MRKNKKLILISSILATTAMVVVPAISIVNNINTVSVSDSQLDNVVQNSGQVESTATLIINSDECDVGSSKATEWMGITAGTGLVNFEIDDVGLTATVKNVPAPTIASSNLKIPGSITYDGSTYTVTSIGSNAFDSCTGLDGLDLSNATSLETIGMSSFSDCSGLTGILTIPDTVTSIGDNAFNGCSGLTGTLTIPASVTSIGNDAFFGCSRLTDVTIPASVTYIGDYAFSNCSGLIGTLTIPASVTSLGEFAFEYCSALDALDLSSATGLKNIGGFIGCTSLTNIIIPASATAIISMAFSGCSSITNITVLATTPPTIAVDSFDIFTATLHVPAGSEDAYKSDAIWSKFKIEPIPIPPVPDPVKPTDNLNLPLIIGATVGGAVVVLATIAGTVTYVIKRNKKLENK